jgi:DNA-binding response OmpR family regulator
MEGGAVTMRSKAQILFVDDQEDLREIMTLLLDRQGYAVSTAGSVAECMALAQQSRFDLYILDSQLPDGNGHELRAELRRLTPRTPALHFTGECLDSGAVDDLKQAGDDYLLKPVCPDDLQHTIGRLLQP